MIGMGRETAAWKGLAFLATSAVMTFGIAARGQMSVRDADARIRGMQGVVDQPLLKRVLTADRTALARDIESSDLRLAGYAVEEAHRRRDVALTSALADRMHDRRSTALSVSAASALGALSGAPRLAALHRGLRDPRVQVRCAAGLSLAPGGDTASIPALREALDQREPGVRIAAASALSLFHDRRSIPQILRLTGELTSTDRRLVCTALGRFRTPETERRLRRMLVGETYAGTRAHAALALGAPGNRSVAPALIVALGDRSSEVRLAAALALEEVGDPRAIPALKRAAESPAPDARNATQTNRMVRLVAHDTAEALTHPTARPGRWPIPWPINPILWQRTHPATVRNWP